VSKIGNEKKNSEGTLLVLLLMLLMVVMAAVTKDAVTLLIQHFARYFVERSAGTLSLVVETALKMKKQCEPHSLDKESFTYSPARYARQWRGLAFWRIVCQRYSYERRLREGTYDEHQEESPHQEWTLEKV